MFPNIPKPTYNEPCFFGIEGLAFISCIAVSSKVPLQTQQKKTHIWEMFDVRHASNSDRKCCVNCISGS